MKKIKINEIIGKAIVVCDCQEKNENLLVKAKFPETNKYFQFATSDKVLKKQLLNLKEQNLLPGIVRIIFNTQGGYYFLGVFFG